MTVDCRFLWMTDFGGLRLIVEDEWEGIWIGGEEDWNDEDDED